MKTWSLERGRKWLVPTLCVVLVATQIVSTSAYENQIGHIKVTTKSVDFVRPLTQVEMTELASMGRISSSLVPVDKLPQREWLLDDSVPAELDVYTSEPYVANFEQTESDGWTAWAATVTWLTAGVTALAQALPAATYVTALCPATPTLSIVASALAITAAIFALLDLATVGNNNNNNNNANTNANTPTANAAQNLATLVASANEDTATAADAATLLLATNPAAVNAATLTEGTPYLTDGGASLDHGLQQKIVKAKRTLMLSFELDGAVLAAF